MCIDEKCSTVISLAVPSFQNVKNHSHHPLKVYLKVFFRWATPSHDDYGKTIGDIRKRFFAFNCQLKKFNGEFFYFSSDLTGSPETEDLLYRYFQYKICEKKSKLGFFFHEFIKNIVQAVNVLTIVI
jgi:hypothetical protein